MKNLLLFILISFFTIDASAQRFTSDSIIVVKNRFIYKGQQINARKMLQLMESNPAAYKEMKIAKTNLDIANAMGFIGGFCAGFAAGQAITGEEMNWLLLGSGIGIMVASIPLYEAQAKHGTEASKIYNAGLAKTSDAFQLKLGLTANGLGVLLTFGDKN